MDDPELGNIISSVGVRAKGDGDNSCHNIRVDLDGCSATIDSPGGISSSLSNLESFQQDGISVRKYPRRVRIAAPNCENVMLVTWVICENQNNQDMIKFVIARGVNLRASSHGLLGRHTSCKIKQHIYFMYAYMQVSFGISLLPLPITLATTYHLIMIRRISTL